MSATTSAPPGWAAHDQTLDAEWDAFVATAMNGTVLHTRRFLSYHGSRFSDQSMVLRDDGGRIVAVLAAAEDPADHSTIVSHPGITYGGLVYGNSLRGEALIDALRALSLSYAERGYRQLVYKAVPWIYHRRLAADDVYALSILGARQTRCSLSAAIDLAAPVQADRPWAYGIRRATRLGVQVDEGWDAIEAFWTVLQSNLAQRYEAAPTHTVAEIGELRDRFPNDLQLLTATIDGNVEAGVVVLHAGSALHTQYIASTERGRKAYALEPVLHCAVEHAKARSAKFFSFGTSSSDGPTGINQSLYRFKLSFGAGSVLHEQFELSLSAA
jgi:Acetyltransferase (GNAT) domain